MAVTINGSGPIAGATTVNGLTLPADSLQPGLVLINKTDFSNVSTVSINNCFSSTYDNYRIVANLIGVGTASWGAFRFRSSGTDNTSSTYGFANLRTTSNAVVQSANAGDGEAKILVGELSSTQYSSHVVEIAYPMIAQWTRAIVTSASTLSGAGNISSTFGGGAFYSTNTFDGITFFMNGGNITGSIRVYGMRNA